VPTNEEQAPADEASSPPDETPATTAESPVPSDGEQHETLSPSVRRLVRQFDLDITGIHGSGPAGRIRVGDVMGLLAGRTDSGKRDAPARPPEPDYVAESSNDGERGADGGERGADDVVEPFEPSTVPPAPTEAATHAAIPTTTVFDCDLSRVLAHRKKMRLDNVELLTTSYFLTALAAALDSTPEISAGHAPRFGVRLTTADGAVRSALLDTAGVSRDSALDERVRAVDAALRANLDRDVSAANLLVHHYGESGSLLATPTPIAPGHEASVGIGRARREIAIRVVDGVETPRVTARCYVTLSFYPNRVPLEHANRCLAGAVRMLETWPD
jgi:pyruvate/2-oxoglutarate dehydrogenase complex dihydrolipoamide acyltransferase (E2) component